MYGPLWSTSTFNSERNNRMFGKLFMQHSMDFDKCQNTLFYVKHCQCPTINVTVIIQLQMLYLNSGFWGEKYVRNHVELCEGTHVFGTPKFKQIDASQTLGLREALQSNVNPVVVRVLQIHCKWHFVRYHPVQTLNTTTKQVCESKVTIEWIYHSFMCNCDIIRTGVCGHTKHVRVVVDILDGLDS